MKFHGDTNLASRIKRKESKDNDLTRDDLLRFVYLFQLVVNILNIFIRDFKMG